MKKIMGIIIFASAFAYYESCLREIINAGVNGHSYKIGLSQWIN